MSTRPRGTCSLCKQRRSLRVDGNVSEHLHPVERTSNGIYRARCDGSGTPPLTVAR